MIKHIISFEEIQQHAKENNIELSKNVIKIVEAINRNDGYCPCKAFRTEETKCPCPNHLMDVEENGHCHCRLFIKR